MSAAPPLLAARGLSKRFRRGSALLDEGREVVALDRVDLEISRGTILGIAGASGSGKTTLGRCLALLEEPDGGELYLEGRDLLGLPSRERRRLGPRIQLLSQDPATALSPRLTALEAVAEPLLFATPRHDRRRRRELALERMAEVGLGPELAKRPTRRLSGGQKRRLVLARALAAGPEVLIVDEGLSNLDLSIQARMANLLLDLRERHALSCAIVSHDLRLLAQLCDEVAVMAAGRIVERARPRELIAHPRHPAARELVEALPDRPSPP